MLPHDIDEQTALSQLAQIPESLMRDVLLTGCR